jgi:histone H1/5
LTRFEFGLTLRDFSRPGLKKYIKANYKGTDGAQFDRLFNLALKKGEAAKEFSFPKGPSGTVKLVKKEPAAKAPAAKVRVYILSCCVERDR